MRVYSIHVRADDVVAVREGFAWSALPVPLLWTLARRMWLWSAVVLAVDLAFAAAFARHWFDPVELAMIAFAFRFLFAAEAHDLLRRALYWRGYLEEGMATGRDADSALRRWADRRGGWDSAFA
ncbi:hypothetical protein [Stella sp.]|uniref:hypothetical protein n=1 Tax=Stella sp. TaxID=2912054 RepID=UPI0035AEBABA